MPNQDLLDSRALFEKHHCGGSNTPTVRRNSEHDHYVLSCIEDAFAGWQSRDALDIPSKGMREVKYITDVATLETGKEYWLVDKVTGQVQVAMCKEYSNWRYFTSGHIWAASHNNQAMNIWDIFGPVPPRTLPNFAHLKAQVMETA